jgi:hypothetical protein
LTEASDTLARDDPRPGIVDLGRLGQRVVPGLGLRLTGRSGAGLDGSCP